MQSASAVAYPDRIRLRVPKGLPDALRLAARQKHTTASEWARQALLRGLEADGVRLGDAPMQESSKPNVLNQMPHLQPDK
jgi:hypothetical protein